MRLTDALTFMMTATSTLMSVRDGPAPGVRQPRAECAKRRRGLGRPDAFPWKRHILLAVVRNGRGKGARLLPALLGRMGPAYKPFAVNDLRPSPGRGTPSGRPRPS